MRLHIFGRPYLLVAASPSTDSRGVDGACQPGIAAWLIASCSDPTAIRTLRTALTRLELGVDVRSLCDADVREHVVRALQSRRLRLVRLPLGVTGATYIGDDRRAAPDAAEQSEATRSPRSAPEPAESPWREPAPDAAPAAAPSSPSPPTCQLLTAAIADAQGRQASASGRLEVVPPEIGEAIDLTAVMEGGCGGHPEWTVRGVLTSTETGSSASFRSNHWRATKPGWLGDVLPQRYTVSVASCAGSQRFDIAAYPSNATSLSFHPQEWKTAKEKVEYVLENMLSAFIGGFRASASYLEGAGSIELGWKEHPADHRAYYGYSISLGFDPLLEISGTFQLGPAAMIPAWITEYGNACLFATLAGGISVMGGWGRTSPDEREESVTAEGYVDLKLGASLFLMNADVLEAEVSGSSGIFAEAEPAERERPSLDLSLSWRGLKGNMTITMGWGVVEYKRSFQIVEGGQLHDTPYVWEIPFLS
jgi:hypothetical protein